MLLGVAQQWVPVITDHPSSVAPCLRQRRHRASGTPHRQGPPRLEPIKPAEFQRIKLVLCGGMNGPFEHLLHRQHSRLTDNTYGKHGPFQVAPIFAQAHLQYFFGLPPDPPSIAKGKPAHDGPLGVPDWEDYRRSATSPRPMSATDSGPAAGGDRRPLGCVSTCQIRQYASPRLAWLYPSHGGPLCSWIGRDCPPPRSVATAVQKKREKKGKGSMIHDEGPAQPFRKIYLVGRWLLLLTAPENTENSYPPSTILGEFSGFGIRYQSRSISSPVPSAYYLIYAFTVLFAGLVLFWLATRLARASAFSHCTNYAAVNLQQSPQCNDIDSDLLKRPSPVHSRAGLWTQYQIF